MGRDVNDFSADSSVAYKKSAIFVRNLILNGKLYRIGKKIPS